MISDEWKEHQKDHKYNPRKDTVIVSIELQCTREVGFRFSQYFHPSKWDPLFLFLEYEIGTDRREIARDPVEKRDTEDKYERYHTYDNPLFEARAHGHAAEDKQTRECDRREDTSGDIHREEDQKWGNIGFPICIKNFLVGDLESIEDISGFEESHRKNFSEITIVLPDHRFYKSHKEWVWMSRTGSEFWMCLSGDHIGMITELDDLCECPIGGCCRDDKSRLFHTFSVCRIELETMAVTF